MSAEFPSLERGESAAVTKRKHIPTWLYKQAHRLTEEMVLIQQELERTGPLNANKQREKALKLLERWYPQVNAFEAKLKPYDDQLKLMRYSETVLRNQVEQAQWELQQEHQESLSLIHGLREYRGFLKSIPEEVLEGLMEQYGQMMEEQQRGQEFHGIL